MRDGRRVGNVLAAALLAAGFVMAATATAVPAPAAAATTSDGQAPAGVGPHTWTTEAITFDLLTGPDADIPVTIDADLWKPTDASAANPMPAIVHQHGYGGHKAKDEQRTNAAYFASHGYVVVTISTQGFGKSTGCIGLDSIQYDGSNVMRIIDWLAAQDYVALDAVGDPKVGLMGGSYGGGHQGMVGVSDARVDALAPGRTWHSLQYSLVPNNFHTAADPWDLDHYEQGVFKQEWTSLFYALGLAQPAQGNGACDPARRQETYPTAAPCAGFIPGICEIYAQLSTLGTADEAGRTLVGTASVATRIDELTTPTIIAQGLPDTLFTPNETVPWALSLQERDVPVAVIWHSSGHGGYQPLPGDGEPYGGAFDDTPERQAEYADTYFARRHLAWFERHVRGDESVDTGPGFAWFRPWVEYDVAQTGGTSAPAYGTSASYPPRDAEQIVLTLDPDSGALAAPGVAVTGGTSSFINPPGGLPAAYSETANTSSPGQAGDQPPTEIPGQNIVFTTTPFASPLDVVGVPELSLQLSHDNPAVDGVLFAKLYDVDPDGNATLIRRQVAPARVPTDAMDAGPVQMHLVGTSWRFETGHSLRLVLASTDLAYYNNKAPDQLTVASSAEAPSTLTVPVIGPFDPTAPTAGSDDGVTDTADDPDLASTGGGAVLAAVLAFGLAAVVRPRRRRDDVS